MDECEEIDSLSSSSSPEFVSAWTPGSISSLSVAGLWAVALAGSLNLLGRDGELWYMRILSHIHATVYSLACGIEMPVSGRKKLVSEL
jgi:hypothetical protein